MGKWVEVVTLLIPGVNDSGAEIARMAEFLAGVSPDLPWHVTAFHPDYRMHERPGTTPAMLVRAAAVGRECGLRYVYAGNAAGSVGSLENTVCPNCGSVLVRRHAFSIGACHVTSDGRCRACRTPIPGRWGTQPA
jgi:pyruvate formate lyase activating enzyme